MADAEGRVRRGERCGLRTGLGGMLDVEREEMGFQAVRSCGLGDGDQLSGPASPAALRGTVAFRLPRKHS